MFLRFHARIKDGKDHRYWSVVENRRCGRGKVVLINGRDEAQDVVPEYRV
jgi:hypothetical protein